jgi:hypothetical protein
MLQPGDPARSRRRAFSCLESHTNVGIPRLHTRKQTEAFTQVRFDHLFPRFFNRITVPITARTASVAATTTRAAAWASVWSSWSAWAPTSRSSRTRRLRLPPASLRANEQSEQRGGVDFARLLAARRSPEAIPFARLFAHRPANAFARVCSQGDGRREATATADLLMPMRVGHVVAACRRNVW